MGENTGRFWVSTRFVDEILEPLGLEIKTFLVLARFANKDRICWPSVTTISDCTGFTEKIVRKHLRHLITCDLIEVIDGNAGGRGKPTKYRLKHDGEERAA